MMLNSRPFLKNTVLIVLFGWPAASILDLLLDEFLPFSFRLYGGANEMLEGALYFSVFFSLFTQAEESALVEKKSLAEISFIRVVAGVVAGLFVGSLLSLPIYIITDHQQLLRILDYVGLFEVGALSAVALWVLIYKKLFWRLHAARYYQEERNTIPPNRGPEDPDFSDEAVPEPTDGDGGANVETPDRDEFSETPLQENLQHLDTELEELSFRDLMERINRHMPIIDGRPIFQLLDYLNRQGAGIDQKRTRLLAAISKAEDANNHQFVQRAQQISEKIRTAKRLILLPIEFPTSLTELRQDFALYTRKVQLLINKLDQVSDQYSELQDALHETISTEVSELRDQLSHAHHAFNASRADWDNITDEERNARLNAYIDQENNLNTAIEHLARLRDQGVSITANIQRRAVETRDRIAVVLPPYFGLLSQLNLQSEASQNGVETNRIVEELVNSTDALDAAIIAYKDAIETADAFAIEEKLERLAIELSEISTDPEIPEAFSAAIEALRPNEPAGDFWRYPYILETPNGLDVFLDSIMFEDEFWESVPVSAESHYEFQEKLEVTISVLEEHRMQMNHFFGYVHL